jgi:hypothetical protein
VNISTSKIETLLNKYGKKLKEEKEYEIHAHEIVLGYVSEMQETSIKPYMEEVLVGLLGDVSENICA